MLLQMVIWELSIERLFGTNEVEIDDGLSDIWGEDAQSQDGVLACIFDLVTVKVKKNNR